MGMNREQYLLGKLAEEGSEVAQMALKTQQFGLDEVYIDESNRQRLHGELNDLLTIVHLLNEEFNFQFSPSVSYAETKIKKIDKYYQYSVQLGRVENEDQNQETKT